jgi:hypothetical protein
MEGAISSFHPETLQSRQTLLQGGILSRAFEELHFLLVFLRGGTCIEGAKVAALPSFGIFLFRIQTVLAGF